MKYALLAAAAVLAISTSAHAGLIGDTTNNYDITNNTPVANAGAQAGAAAGAVAGATGGSATGGSVGDIDVRGGAGGSATSTLGSLNSFGGQGGSVLGSGNSANTNANTNLQGQGQFQGQNASSDQAQSQSAYSNVSNAGNSTNTNTTSSRTDNANNSSQATNVTVEGDNIPRQVASATAPIVVNVASCAIGGSVAGQGPGFGFALGGARIDKDCNARADAQILYQLGEKEAAVLLLSAHSTAINAAVTEARTRK